MSFASTITGIPSANNKFLFPNAWTTPTTPVFLPKTTNSDSVNVSTINAWNMNINSITGLSTINNVAYPNTPQLSGASITPVSGKVITPASWQPLISTTTLFNTIAGKTYDMNFPLGADISVVPNDANANILFGLGLQNHAIPPTAYTVHTQSNDSQVFANGTLRTVATAPATGQFPLVVSVYTQNTSANATISALGGGGSVAQYMVNQLN